MADKKKKILKQVARHINRPTCWPHKERENSPHAVFEFIVSPASASIYKQNMN